MSQGLILFDPHGFLYDSMVNYLSFFPELAEKVILFDPTYRQSINSSQKDLETIFLLLGPEHRFIIW